MPFDDLSPQQQEFLRKYLWSGIAGLVANKTIVANFEEFERLDAKFVEDAKAVPTDHPEHGEISKGLAPARKLRDEGEFSKGVSALSGMIERMGTLKAGLEKKRTAILKEVEDTADPKGASEAEKAKLETGRKAVREPLADAVPTAADFGKAEKALETLRATARAAGGNERVRGSLDALEKTNPKAAAKAKELLAGFAAATDGLEITPEVFDKAAKDLADAQAEFVKAEKALATAEAMPQGDAGEIEARNKAIEKANRALFDTTDTLRGVEAKSNAIMGRKLLGEAVEFGALSPVAPRPLADESAELLIAAFGRDPRLAGEAAEVAATAREPDLVAKAVGPMCDRVAIGFAQGTQSFDDEESRTYAARLLTLGGEVGGTYFDGLDDYLKTGGQFAKKPFGPAADTSFNALALTRTRGVAGALLNSSGQIDLTTTEAKTALGHLRYNADELRNPTPALVRNTEKTLGVLTDPVTGPQAQGLLDTANPPSGGAGRELVRGAVGKPFGSVTKKDTQSSILSAMLMPFSQGPVGSCFSTAPALRMRETDPIAAMTAFHEIATTGTYKPANGPRVPAVTNLPKNSEPLMRSWEYSLATSTARTQSARENKKLTKALDGALDRFEPIVSDKGYWASVKPQLQNDIASNFSLTYDPTETITKSNDGSSSAGRYVMIDGGTGNKVTTQKAFTDAITRIALARFGVSATSDAGRIVAGQVTDQRFIDAVTPDGWKPWDLQSGGYGDSAHATLFGGDPKQTEVLGKDTSWFFGPSEGTRTVAVLTEMVESFEGSTEELATVDTTGMHSFNAMPNHPSLSKIKGGSKEEKAKKIDKELLQPGKTLKDTDLSADRAAFLFDRQLNAKIKGEKDTALKALLETGAKDNRPTGPMKPAGISAAVKKAIAAWSKRKAEIRTQEWEREQIIKGDPPGTDAIEKKKTEVEKSFDEWFDGEARGALARELGSPEFVIADTNWGDSRNHTFFVIAPDPVTGEPQMWKKEEPPGTLTPAKKDWVDARWAKVG